VRCKILIFVVLVGGQGLARVGTRYASRPWTSRIKIALGTVHLLSASPGTISFQASNPDSGMVTGSSPASLSWSIQSGSTLKGWTLSVQADSSSFAGCPTVPVSAVQVSCGSATAGGGGTGACGGSFPLSTSPGQIAGGAQGDGTNSYLVSINFTLAESWRYVAKPSCSITLNYSVNAQ
jgi:hypothetical protein